MKANPSPGRKKKEGGSAGDDLAHLANITGAFALILSDRIATMAETSLGYSGETAAALVTIGAEPGHSVDWLSKVLALSQPGTVRLVDRLVQEGWVDRGRGRDKRSVALYLSESGKEQRRKILALRQDYLESLIEQLPRHHKIQLQAALHVLLHNMTTDAYAACRICRLCNEEKCEMPRCPVDLAVPADERFVSLPPPGGAS
ncbi:MAG TPA: MarR family winged helix-turn-helix transcriptional regulator [Dongiaceae bacterium]|jgi:DNA-binding MarR family transcriptional regulator|nr:MarR family winged helix-turn-helix transcriptional regulator [Dongiaceae bacterium]